MCAPLLVSLSGCLETSSGYLAEPDRGFALRYPRDWDEVAATPEVGEWIQAVDAAEPPSTDHAGTFAVDAPFLIAQVRPLSPAEADTFTLARLRELARSDRVDPTGGTDGTVHVHFHERVRTDRGFEGHHMRFDMDQEGQRVTVEHFAALAPDRSALYRVRVACVLACFERNASEIEQVFESIDLRR